LKDPRTLLEALPARFRPRSTFFANFAIYDLAQQFANTMALIAWTSRSCRMRSVTYDAENSLRMLP
jgi:hypothetical protein